MKKFFTLILVLSISFFLLIEFIGDRLIKNILEDNVSSSLGRKVTIEKLNIDYFQGVDNKVMMLKQYCSQYDYHLKKVGYVGNDINDMEAMKIVEYSFCPADAHPDILNISKFILKSNGGGGVIRELYDLINLKSIFNHSN